MTKNIIFFYPSKIVGGAELLFARLAKYLKEKYNLNIFYIDYINGFVRNNPEFAYLNFIDYTDDKKTEIDINGYLITPISNIYRLTDYVNFNDNIKLFFWCIHPFNIIHVMPENKVLLKCSSSMAKFLLTHAFKNTFKIFDTLLKYCTEKNSIYFMDYDNYITNKMLFEKSVEENYLPVISITKTVLAQPNIIKKDEINITVLGRLCKEKTTALINVLEQFNNLQTNKKKRLHIIGDGEYLNFVKSKTKKTKNVEVLFAGTLTGDKLNNYLINNTDILFSMGMSALDGAALKLPVVLLPYSYSKIKNNKFYFLFDSKKYSLGTNIDNYKKNGNLTLENIINLIINENKKAEIGNKCYEYYINNHSIEQVSKKLINALDCSKLTAKEYKEILKNTGKLIYKKSIIYKIIRSVII